MEDKNTNKQNTTEQSKASLDVLLHLHGSLRELHTFADKKAYAALTIFGAIGLGSPLYLEKIVKSVDKFHCFWQCLVVMMMLTFLILVIMGLWHTILTLIPRIVTSNESIVFFGHVVTLKQDELKEAWQKQTEKELFERLIVGYHNSSQIAVTKFKHSRLALLFAASAIVLFSIITLFSLDFEKNKHTPSNPSEKIVTQNEVNQTK